MVLRAGLDQLRLPESLATTADRCSAAGLEHCLGSTIAFAADKGMLQPVQSQCDGPAIGLVVEEANAAKGLGSVVTVGLTHVGGFDCPQQRPSAALCIELATAAVGTAPEPEPEPESDPSGADSIALAVPDPAALQLCWTLGCTEAQCSLTARVAAAVGSVDCTVSEA